MMDKDNMNLNEKQLEDAVGGLSISEIMDCETIDQVMKLIAKYGFNPGSEGFNRFVNIWNMNKNV